jgi:hypothetical protein
MEIGESAAVGAGDKPADPKPRIVSVAFLDKDDTTELAGNGKHFVNLPRDAKWVDGTQVANIDRLSQKVRFKVRFDKPGSHSFKVKFKPGASNAAYTGAEKGRNANFKYEEDEKSYTTDADGTKIVPTDFFVTAAGKDSWQLVAKDDQNNEVTSNSITTHKLVYCVELKMTGLTTVASSLSVMTGEFSRHNTEFVALASVNMDHMHNVSNTDTATFTTKARTAYTGSTGPSKEPYVVAIAYTDHLAVKDENQPVGKLGVDVGPGKPDVTIDIIDQATSERKYLWNNIVPGEGWFVSCKFLKDGGTAGTDDVTIPEADCTLVPIAASVPDMSSEVKVKVSGLTAARGKITLTVNWVNRMRGGISLGGNIVCVCTRAWWQTISTADQNQVMIHELGHQLNMVADGTGTGPDKVSTHYTGKGHVGPHCHEGLPVQASYATATGSACVMFGATNGVTMYCSKCAPAVIKQDLSAGFTRF